MSLINTKSTNKKLDADAALEQAVEWVLKHQTSPFPPVTGQDYALISIAASLREISRKLR